MELLSLDGLVSLYGQARSGLNTFAIEVKNTNSMADAMNVLVGVIGEEFSPAAATDVYLRGIKKKLVPAICNTGSWPNHLREYIIERQADMHDASAIEFVFCGKGRYMFWGVTTWERKTSDPVKPQPEAI